MRWVLGFFAAIGCFSLILAYTSFRGWIPFVLSGIVGYMVISKTKG